ncbi:MAG: hypothetical protein J1E01_09315 [Acetatifactor sp.]|nr:hypothetical protein [Acetatifactor sp.]
MLITDIKSEKDAIHQYKLRRSMICANAVNAVLARIIQDEEYHIMVLQDLLDELDDSAHVEGGVRKRNIHGGRKELARMQVPYCKK